MPLLSTVLASSLILAVSGYSSGPPASVCTSLTPGHGGELQDNDQSPFVLELGSQEAKVGDFVSVRIENRDDEGFKGFLVQARDGEGNVVGQFLDLG